MYVGNLGAYGFITEDYGYFWMIVGNQGGLWVFLDDPG